MDKPPAMTDTQRKQKQRLLDAEGYIRLVILSKREDLCTALKDVNLLNVNDQDDKEKINEAAGKILNHFVGDHMKEKYGESNVTRDV